MAPLVLAAAVLACRASAPSAQFESLVPLVIDSVEHYARQAAFPAGRGPLLLDVASFRRAARSVPNHEFDTLAVPRAVARPFLNASAEVATQCKVTEYYSCWIRDDGVVVAFDEINKTLDGYVIVMTTHTTTLIPSGPSATCPVGAAIRATRVDARWSLSRELISEC